MEDARVRNEKKLTSKISGDITNDIKSVSSFNWFLQNHGVFYLVTP